MKRLIFPLIVQICTTISFAQSTQNGVIKEYNDAKKKTPLAGVEIIVNNAGKNVSAKNGTFTLTFRTLKPGDKVEVRKIEKAGYEIFNKDALDTWRIANDGSEFTIVLCKSAKFKALKDQYNAVASKSYAQQQKKDEERLANLLKEGKLQQAEYEKQLKELKDRYDEQLENLDNYIDRFARIDLETISKEEQKIIEMVKAGKIDDAIATYEAMNLEDKYAQAVENIGIATDAISQLEKVKADNENARREAYLAVKRMNDTRRLQGSEENYRKIGESLRRIAEMDTTQLYPLYEYADFAADQNDIKEAIKYYNIILLSEKDVENRAVILQRYSNVCVYEDPEKALGMALDSEQILDSLVRIGQNVEKNKLRLLRLYNSIANIYNYQRNLEKAEHYYLISLKQHKERGLENLKDKTDYTIIACNLGTLYVLNGNFNNAIEWLTKAYSIQSNVLKESYTIDNKNILFNCAVQLGTAYGRIDKIADSKSLFDKAVRIYEELKVENPQAFKDKGSVLYNNIGSMFLSRRYYSEAEKYFLKALNCVEEGFDENQTFGNIISVIVIRGVLGATIANIDGRSREGLNLIEQSLTEIKPYYSQYPDILRHFYVILLQQKTTALIECLEYRKSMDAIEEALEISHNDANNWDIKGYVHTKLEEWEESLDCWKKVIEIDSDFLKHGLSDLYDSLIAKGIITESLHDKE